MIRTNFTANTRWGAGGVKSEGEFSEERWQKLHLNDGSRKRFWEPIVFITCAPYVERFHWREVAVRSNTLALHRNHVLPGNPLALVFLLLRR